VTVNLAAFGFQLALYRILQVSGKR